MSTSDSAPKVDATAEDAEPRALTPEEHKARHVMLHQMLDELFADYIFHHRDEHGFTNRPIMELIKWSYEQTENPTDRP